MRHFPAEVPEDLLASLAASILPGQTLALSWTDQSALFPMLGRRPLEDNEAAREFARRYDLVYIPGMTSEDQIAFHRPAGEEQP